MLSVVVLNEMPKIGLFELIEDNKLEKDEVQTFLCYVKKKKIFIYIM